MVCGLCQYGSQIGIALFADVQLRFALPGVSPPRLQSQITTHIGAVPTEKSIALKKCEQRWRGNEFLGLRKHWSKRRVVSDPLYRFWSRGSPPRGLCIHFCGYIKEEAMAQAARRSYRW